MANANDNWITLLEVLFMSVSGDLVPGWVSTYTLIFSGAGIMMGLFIRPA